MHIDDIKVENFKSLVDFDIDLAGFNCLIGLNGSGKSTVLQFIDFLSQTIKGDMQGWLQERKWKSTDLRSKLTRKLNINWTVQLGSRKEAAFWEATYTPSKNRCTRERIVSADVIFEVTSDMVEIHYPGTDEPPEFLNINFKYEGSVLSAMKEDLLPQKVLQCKKSLLNIKSLDLLAPEFLRQRVRESAGTLGRGGQNLSAFLHEMNHERRSKLLKRLNNAYPQLRGISSRSLRSGWKQIEIDESFMGAEGGFLPSMVTEARHINDGMLRLMAILAELQSDYTFLLFDEIENGINPELVEFVINELVTSQKQILVTTHSPMILNYLEDETARQGVTYLYKTKHGHTKSIPFFSIPSLAEKLTVMGPGEAFVDTNLLELRAEIAELTGEEQ